MKDILQNSLPIFLFVLTMVTFVAFGIDKQKAKKGKWRISEKTLIILCLLGGVLGGIAGMWFFKHKTRHSKFHVTNVLSIILWVIIWLIIL